jgi:hypothetical protein
MPQSLEDIIQAAHFLVGALLRTEVTTYDVETALERCCEGWTDEGRETALRLAVEFAQIRGYAFLEAMDASHNRNMAEMEHHCFVAYELGDHLDLPVDFVWSEEDRERSILSRHVLYPLQPE